MSDETTKEAPPAVPVKTGFRCPRCNDTGTIQKRHPTFGLLIQRCDCGAKETT